jgi:hypothetical protein
MAVQSVSSPPANGAAAPSFGGAAAPSFGGAQQHNQQQQQQQGAAPASQSAVAVMSTSFSLHPERQSVPTIVSSPSYMWPKEGSRRPPSLQSICAVPIHTLPPSDNTDTALATFSRETGLPPGDIIPPVEDQIHSRAALPSQQQHQHLDLPAAETTILGSFVRNVPRLPAINADDSGDESLTLLPSQPPSLSDAQVRQLAVDAVNRNEVSNIPSMFPYLFCIFRIIVRWCCLCSGRDLAKQRLCLNFALARDLPWCLPRQSHCSNR